MRLLDRCKQAYAFAKIDKLDSLPTSPKIRGCVVHNALEIVGRARLHGNTKPVSEAELREAYERACATYKASAAVQGESWEILKPLAENLDFSACIAVLDFSACIAVEENWSMPVDGDALGGGPFTVVGAFDRIDVRDGMVEIHDYKSGADVKSVAELRDDPQVLLYAAYVRSHWTGPFCLVFHFLAAGIPVVVRGTDLGERGLSLAKSKMAEIRAMETWPASTGPHCVNCDFRSVCPAYAKLAKAKAEDVPANPASASDEELLRERQRCSTLSRLFEEHRKVCDEAIRERLETNAKVFGGGLRAKLVTRVKRSLPDHPEVVAEALAGCRKHQDHDARDYVVDAIQKQITSLDERKIKEYLKALDEDERRLAEGTLDAMREERDLASYVDVRPITGGF